jgi:PAS domain S-box-containing protein
VPESQTDHDFAQWQTAAAELKEQRDHLQNLVDQRTTELTYMNGLLRQEVLIRRHAEQEAEDLRQKNELILNSVDEGIFGLDLARKFTLVNPAAVRMLGYRVDELLGQELGMIAGPELYERLARLDAISAVERLAPSQIDYDQSFQRRDSSRFPVGYVASVIAKAHQVVGYVIAFADITERTLYHQQLQRQSHRLGALHAVDRAIQSSQSPQAIASAALTQIGELVPCEDANIVLYDLAADTYEPLAWFDSSQAPDSLGRPGELSAARHVIGRQQQGQTYTCDCQGTDARVCQVFNLQCSKADCSAIFVPLMYQTELIGSLNLVRRECAGFSVDELDILTEVTDSLVVAIQNARLFRQVRDGRERLRALAEYLQSARESERQTIARELHDEFGQALSVLKMDLGWIDRRLSKKALALHQRVEQMNLMIDNLTGLLHKVATELRPVMLDDLGLPAAIEWQVQEFSNHTGLACQLSLDRPDVVLDPQTALRVFRILQEALTNIARHAHATHAEVWLKMSPTSLSLTIHDDGVGIDEHCLNDPLSLGLLGMRERAISSGGSVTISGAPGAGTTVAVEIPLAPAESG